ncbi:DsrE family protein [Methanobacterium formicicum]|uniref:DsrE family protein n=1 Tax=Methanobacterium formicicum (strain DSM 3637 / PP1) TaxID=1204725 RepID=K2RU59_METFP|nr:DsrE family protein [Methanobacterium formicicum]EKF86295.1 DsrE family protein [Methanobacterium formicicum DSM 3637]
MKTIKLLGIKAPNASIMVDNILKQDPTGGLIIILSPGTEEGLEKVASKYGLVIEAEHKEKEVVIRLVENSGGLETLEELDVTGQTCPGPIIIAGDKLGSMANGDRVKIKNNNLETIEDIAIAMPEMGGKVLDQGTDGEKHYLVIEKVDKKDSKETTTSVKRDKVLVVQSNGIGNAERAYATFIFAKAALSMGKKVGIFLLMDGVSIARKGNAATVKHPAFDRLDHLMTEAIDAGATIYVCELSANFRGIKQKDLEKGCKLAGAATYVTLLSDPTYAVVNF